MRPPPLTLIGCGYTLTRLARREAGSRLVLASTRDAGRAAELAALGATVFADPLALARASAGAHAVISIPPEAGLDASLAEALAASPPAKLVYLSSTGVYGRATGEVDEQTPVDRTGPGAARVAAEEVYRALGGIVLRPAGIYGPGRGLHERLRAGTFRMPGGGAGRISRIHVDDLVEAIRCALAGARPGETFNVADDRPTPLREVVDHLTSALGVPTPPQVPAEEVPTLSGDRAVLNHRLRKLGWRPAYPGYQEGFRSLL